MDFVAIDFETANSNRNSVCALGIVEVLKGKIHKQKMWLIKPPELFFDPFNISIHGITEDDVKDKPEFAEQWEKLYKLCDGRPLVAHNAAFDMSVLRHVLDYYGITYPRLRYYCTLVIARKTWPDLLSYSLPIVADHLDISFIHHNAEEDARASAEIAIKACRKSKISNLSDLAYAKGFHEGQLYPGGYRPCGVSYFKKTRRYKYKL